MFVIDVLVLEAMIFENILVRLWPLSRSRMEKSIALRHHGKRFDGIAHLLASIIVTIAKQRFIQDAFLFGR